MLASHFHFPRFLDGRLLCGLFVCAVLGCQPNASEPPGNQSSPVALPAIPVALTVESDWTQAKLLAQQSGKPLCVFFTAKWCKHCQLLQQGALAQSAVQAAGQRFIWVNIDADQQSAICEQYGIKNFPTLLCLGNQGQLLGRLVGNQPTEQVLQMLQNAWQTQYQTRLPVLERR